MKIDSRKYRQIRTSNDDISNLLAAILEDISTGLVHVPDEEVVEINKEFSEISQRQDRVAAKLKYYLQGSASDK